MAPDPCREVSRISVGASPVTVAHSFAPTAGASNRRCNWALSCTNSSRRIKLEVTAFTSAAFHEDAKYRGGLVF